jgi:hypothetical protein
LQDKVLCNIKYKAYDHSETPPWTPTEPPRS